MRRPLFLRSVDVLASRITRRVSGNAAPYRPRILASGGIALSVLLLPALHRPSLRLVWNVTASVPIGLYRVLPYEVPRRSELAAIRPSPSLTRYMAARHYVETGALLVKPVAAVSGQRVCRTGAIITIDGVRTATARSADRYHRPLPVWAGCYRLRDGAVFLLAPAVSASFDGRYFGPVARESILGRAVPLWTWQ